MRIVLVGAAAVLCLSLPASPAAAQSQGRIEIAGTVTSTTVSEFDSVDTGIGVRVSWYPRPLIGIEGEYSFFPEDFPSDRRSFSADRREGLVGVTVGSQMGPLRVFGKARAGFLKFGEAPEPLACIAIFPPTLECSLAGGDTLTAVDIGAGLSMSLPAGMVVRVDAGSLLLSYPGPVRSSDRQAHEDGFLSRNLRLAFSAGWRF